MIINDIPVFKRLLVELQSNCNRKCFFCNRHGDDSGIRIGPDGKRIIQSMPTKHVLRILDEASSMRFKGIVGFHALSEAFLDPRIIDMAWEAKKRGMRPYIHTNADKLKRDDALAKAAAEVFEYIVVGLYDYQDEAELVEEKRFWRQRLQDTRVRFSEVGRVIPRAHVPYDSRMVRKKRTYPSGICVEPLRRLRIHYNGNISLCCEDMKEEFDLGNAFETSIREIWYSEKHIQIVKDLKKGLREKYSLCSMCPRPSQSRFATNFILKCILK
jgi:radical SAM protein with 4Fe4S-binding SPASM domain